MSASPEASPKAATGATGKPPLIAVRGVHKTYKLGEQSVRALDGVSFEIREGEYVAIMGPSGSGKSTMMNLIGALDVPTAGELRIAGRDITTLPSDALAAFRNRTIGFVFQQFNLLARTSALRQVMLPLAYARPRPANAGSKARTRLEQVGLGDRKYHVPSSFPAANSNASRSRARSSTTRNCCWRTSQRVRSIQRRRKRSCGCSVRSTGRATLSYSSRTRPTWPGMLGAGFFPGRQGGRGRAAKPDGFARPCLCAA